MLQENKIGDRLLEILGQYRSRVTTLGLSPDEIEFYDALAENESAVRESLRTRLWILVRSCLRKWKYSSDQQSEAVELVLKPAEPLSKSGTI